MPSAEPLVDEEVLCRNVRAFSLRYFDGYTWQESWDSTTLDNALPLAVAMTLELDDPANPAPAGMKVPGRAVTRVFPLACAKLTDLTGGGL
jgi:hypothetical protein